MNISQLGNAYLMNMSFTLQFHNFSSGLKMSESVPSFSLLNITPNTNVCYCISEIKSVMNISQLGNAYLMNMSFTLQFHNFSSGLKMSESVPSFSLLNITPNTNVCYCISEIKSVMNISQLGNAYLMNMSFTLQFHNFSSGLKMSESVPSFSLLNITPNTNVCYCISEIKSVMNISQLGNAYLMNMSFTLQFHNFSSGLKMSESVPSFSLLNITPNTNERYRISEIKNVMNISQSSNAYPINIAFILKLNTFFLIQKCARVTVFLKC